MAGPGAAQLHPQHVVGRCEMFHELATGGFASVHLGRLIGAGGFHRIVAVKRLHRQFAADATVRDMFLDEARIVSRVKHPNVMPILDLIEEGDELFLVLEYVEGVTLARLRREVQRRDQQLPVPMVLHIISGMLQGLHAAHEARGPSGEQLEIVHRDVTPDNVMVGVDGSPRVIDFGVARAVGQSHASQKGELKGKLAYMAPEQVRGRAVTRRTDVFAASVVLWQALTGERLFGGGEPAETMYKVLHEPIAPPSVFGAPVSPELDAIVMRGLARDENERWPTALAMADAIDALRIAASAREVGVWVQNLVGDHLAEVSQLVRAIELAPSVARSGSGFVPPSIPGSGDARASQQLPAVTDPMVDAPTVARSPYGSAPELTPPSFSGPGISRSGRIDPISISQLSQMSSLTVTKRVSFLDMTTPNGRLVLGAIAGVTFLATLSTVGAVLALRPGDEPQAVPASTPPSATAVPSLDDEEEAEDEPESPVADVVEPTPSEQAVEPPAPSASAPRVFGSARAGDASSPSRPAGSSRPRGGLYTRD